MSRAPFALNVSRRDIYDATGFEIARYVDEKRCRYLEKVGLSVRADEKLAVFFLQRFFKNSHLSFK